MIHDSSDCCAYIQYMCIHVCVCVCDVVFVCVCVCMCVCTRVCV